MKTSAAVLVEVAKPLQLIDSIIIPPVSFGQVLVKIAYSGFCHSQLMEAAGKRGHDKYLPHLLGHEATGIVIDVGEGVTKVKPGDRVVLGWIKGIGHDVKGAIYDSPIGKINSGPVTTFNEYSVVSENRCYLLPNNLSMQEGVLLGCALPTGMGIVKNQICPNENTSIGILGLGGIGMSALMAAVTLPHREIIAIDTNPEKLATAEKLGASSCLNPKFDDLSERIREITDGRMLDFLVEAAGTIKTIELGFSLINLNSGHCIFASHPSSGDKLQIDPFELICGKKITGSWGGDSKPEDICCFVSEKKAHFDLAPFMKSQYKLDDINQAMSDLENQKILRAILEIDAEL